MDRAAIRIIGIDPGLRNTGWGILDLAGAQLDYVASGVVRAKPEAALGERLRELHQGLTRIIAEFAPDEAAVEETFVNRDPQSALKLGQARGIALVVPALAGLPVAEYAANLIKKTVVGTGHAEKSQIAMMVKVLLPKCAKLSDFSADAADALAVAITHARYCTQKAVRSA
jgi:crossover junction endodeoxyribonuclease RuvC